MQGTILKFYPERRYGFLQDTDTSVDYFFHRGDVKDEVVPAPGTAVHFDVGEHQGKKKAFNVVTLTAQQILGGGQ
jgi:cold shock CspA family protein